MSPLLKDAYGDKTCPVCGFVEYDMPAPMEVVPGLARPTAHEKRGTARETRRRYQSSLHVIENMALQKKLWAQRKKERDMIQPLALRGQDLSGEGKDNGQV